MATGTTTAAMFCRQCGYNLYGLPSNHCPECGQGFDPSDPRTYRKYAASFARRRRAKRIGVGLMVLVLAGGTGALGLWWPWHREQAGISMFQRCGGRVFATTVGPHWLQRLLGQRGGFLLERVKAVDLNFPLVTDTNLTALEGLSELEMLDLYGAPVTDAGLVHLKDLQELRVLSLGGTEVTDAGLEQLKGLQGLQRLYLAGTYVTDAGLEHLKDLKALQMVDLHRTRVTDGGVAALRQALPACEIRH